MANLPNDTGLPQEVVEGTITGGPGRRADQDLPVDFWLYKYKASILYASFFAVNANSSRATFPAAGGPLLTSGSA